MVSNMKKLLEDMVSRADLIPHHNYWMIRSDGGKSYEPFLQHGIVAIRMPYVTQSYASTIANTDLPVKMALNEIKSHFETLSKDPRILLSESLKELQNQMTRSTRASQLYVFSKVIQKGDVVLVPSEGTSHVSIGIIKENGLYTDNYINKRYPLCKSVEWLNQIPRYRLDPGLHRALSAHQAISNLSDYEEYIERSINSCFVKDNVCNYVLTLNSSDINAEKFFSLGSDVISMLRLLNDQYQLGIDPSEINLSLNLNSPGKVVFKSKAISIAFLIMGLFSACSDGRVAYENNASVHGDSFMTIVDSIRNENRGDAQALKTRINQCLRSTEALALEKWNEESLNSR